MASSYDELIPSQIHKHNSSTIQTREEKFLKGTPSSSKSLSDKNSKPKKTLNRNAKEFLPSVAKDNDNKKKGKEWHLDKATQHF